MPSVLSFFLSFYIYKSFSNNEKLGPITFNTMCSFLLHVLIYQKATCLLIQSRSHLCICPLSLLLKKRGKGKAQALLLFLRKTQAALICIIFCYFLIFYTQNFFIDSFARYLSTYPVIR